MLLPDDAHPLLVATGIPSSDAGRVWFRSPVAGEVELTCEEQGSGRVVWRASTRIPSNDREDGTRSLEIDGLTPDTAYRVHVRPSEATDLAAHASFRTAPDQLDEREWSFGFGSCHLPFEPDGRVASPATEMLAAVRAELQRIDASFFVAIGDQMYTDLPRDHSLFNPEFLRGRLQRIGAPSEGVRHPTQCEPEVVRALYQERYRQFWAVPGWRGLLGDLPTAMMWDDHEIVDNWGSEKEHTDDRWDRVLRGARAAAIDYEQAIGRSKDEVPDTFDRVIDRGSMSLVLLDLRARRRPETDLRTARVLSDAQFAWLDRALRERSKQAAVFVVTTVPVAHVPARFVRWLSRLLPLHGDLSDRWPTADHRADRDRLLERLREHAMGRDRPRVVLLAGDIHAAGAQVLRWPGADASKGPRPAALHQWISSPISNRSYPWSRRVSAAAIRATKSIEVRGFRWRVTMTPGVEHADANPLSSMNFGVVSVRGSEGVRLRLFGLRGVRFDSGWL